MSESEDVFLNVRLIATATNSRGPWVFGAARCRMCGAIENAIMPAPDNPMDMGMECSGCGLMESYFVDGRDETVEGADGYEAGCEG